MKIQINLDQPIKSLEEMKRLQLAFFFLSNVRLLDLIGEKLETFLNQNENACLAYDSFHSKLCKLQARRNLRTSNLKQISNDSWSFSTKA